MGQTWDNCCLKFNNDYFFEHIQVLRRKKYKKKDELFADYQKRYTFAADITTKEMRTIMVNTYWWRFLQLTKS